MIRQNINVLVLGEDTRSFLSVIRSLGHTGYSVHVVCYDKTSPALVSKYIKSAKFYNYQAYSADEWLENVISLVDKYQFDLIIPCDERAIYPLWSAKARLPEHTKLAIANQKGLDTLFDKWETKKAAISCHVPVAKGNIVDISTVSYADLLGQFGSRFVVKPLQSFEETKLYQRQKVAIIRSEDEYLEYQKRNSTEQPYLIEEFFAGKGEGLSVLSIEGEVYAAFAHVRVAEPKSGGGSSYRKSIPLDNELLEATKAICKHSKLTGVAMFEFRRNQSTREWILVEVNARFWGSLPLAVFAGVDFPKLYADYLVFGSKPESPIVTYRNDVYARTLIADLYEIKREFEISREEEGKLSAFVKLVFRLLQILRVVSPVETIDSFSIKDLRPFIAETSLLAKSFLFSVLGENSILLKIRRYKTKKLLHQLFKINKNRRIIFICYGNIMRSPFAEACMREVVEIGQQDQDIKFDSYGFHLAEHRRSPEKAVKAAEVIGYALSEHESKWLTQLDLHETDIVIYFDNNNQSKLSAYYHVNHAFCAADLLDNTFPIAAEIEDPYDGNDEKVLHCYRMINNSVTGLVKIYKEAI